MGTDREQERKLNPHYVMRWWMTSLPPAIPPELRLTINALFAYTNDWFTRPQLTPNACFTSGCSHSQIAAYVGRSPSTVKRYLAELRQKFGLLTWEDGSNKNAGNLFTIFAVPQESIKNDGVNVHRVEQARRAAQTRWQKVRQLKPDATGQLTAHAEVSSIGMLGSAHSDAASAQFHAGSAHEVSYSGFSGSSGKDILGKTTVETTVNVSPYLSVEQREKIQPTADCCPCSTNTAHTAGSDGVCGLCGFDNPDLCNEDIGLVLRQFSELTRAPYESLVSSKENRKLAVGILQDFTKDEIIAVMKCVMTTGYWSDKITTFRFFVDKFADKLVPAHAAFERGERASKQAAKRNGKLGLAYQDEAGKFFKKGNVIHV
jgi:hypothetical protein